VELFIEIEMSSNKKTCSICKEHKSFVMFNKDKKMKDGYHSQCKECRKNNRNKPKQNTTEQLIENILGEMSSNKGNVDRLENLIGDMSKLVCKLKIEQQANENNSLILTLEQLGLTNFNDIHVLSKLQDPLLSINKIVDSKSMHPVSIENNNVLIVFDTVTFTGDDKHSIIECLKVKV